MARTQNVVTVSNNRNVARYREADGSHSVRPRVSDRSIEAWQPPSADVLERCFGDVREPGELAARVTVQFDAEGGARAVSTSAQAGVHAIVRRIGEKLPSPVDGLRVRKQ